jgi:hypothetical protein
MPINPGVASPPAGEVGFDGHLAGQGKAGGVLQGEKLAGQSLALLLLGRAVRLFAHLGAFDEHRFGVGGHKGMQAEVARRVLVRPWPGPGGLQQGGSAGDPG